MKHYLIVGLGGALGAIARVALSRFFPSFILGIPFKILCVNALGCLFLGILTEVMTLYWDTPFNMRAFLSQGFLGGFTTFSAFALEFGLLYEKGSHISAIFYAVFSVALSITFFFAGLRMIRLFS